MHRLTGLDVDIDGERCELNAGPPVSFARRSLTDLVRTASSGDAAAWNELVDRCCGIVWAVAMAHGLSDADAADVSQTTWMRFIECLDGIDQGNRVGAWLAATARRESVRVLRLGGHRT